MIAVAASISRRKTALSRTIFAWYSTFAAVGTTSMSPPRYSMPGERSGDETAGDADVIPGRLLPMGVPEQGGRMVRNDNRNAPEPMDLVPQGAERLLGVEERLRRGPAHREDHPRLHELDLAKQVGDARRDLVVLRLPVLGRPAPHHVADERPFARQVDRGEDLGQELARRSHERPPRLVFHTARALAHDDEAR